MLFVHLKVFQDFYNIIYRPRKKILNSFISNSFFYIICKFHDIFLIPMIFKSSKYTIIKANLESDFLIKTHGQIGLLSNPSFIRHSIRKLYHM